MVLYNTTININKHRLRTGMKPTIFIMGIIATLLIINLASAATYYIDAINGNDNNNGLSVSTAWRSFANIITYYSSCSSLQPAKWVDLGSGDHVYVMNGTYYPINIGTWTDCSAGPKNILNFRDPIPANPYIIEAYAGEKPVFDEQGQGVAIYSYSAGGFIIRGFEIKNSTVECIHLANTNNVILENLNIHDCFGDPGNNVAGIKTSGAYNITIRNNLIHHIVPNSPTTMHNVHGIVIFEGNNIIINNNEIYDANSGIKYKHHGVPIGNEPFNAQIYRNLVHDIHGELGISTGTDNAQVYQNIIYNVAEQGFEVDQADPAGGYSTFNNNSFYHNTLYNVSTGFSGSIRGLTRDSFFRDNIINANDLMINNFNLTIIKYSDYNCYNNNRFGYQIQYTPSYQIVNLAFMNSLGYDMNSIITTNVISNPPNSFQLTSDSPCRNSASDGYHIGAYLNDSPDYVIGLFNTSENNLTIVCTLPFDSDPCNCINSGELASTISAWNSGSLTINQLIINIKKWKECSS